MRDFINGYVVGWCGSLLLAQVYKGIAFGECFGVGEEVTSAALNSSTHIRQGDCRILMPYTF